MRKIKGVIVSDRMRHTVVVRADRLKEHPAYRKRYRVSRRFKAHDPEQKYRTGDVVVIEETRPMSREKRWKVTRLIKRVENASEEVNGAADQENQESRIKNQGGS